MHTIEFSLRGNDPTNQTIKNMVEGIINQVGDTTTKIGERKVIVGTTENAEIADLLTRIAKMGPNSRSGTKRRGPVKKKIEAEE